MIIFFTKAAASDPDKCHFILDTNLLKNTKLKERIEAVCIEENNWFEVDKEYKYCFPEWDGNTSINDLEPDAIMTDISSGFRIDTSGYWCDN